VLVLPDYKSSYGRAVFWASLSSWLAIEDPFVPLEEVALAWTVLWAVTYSDGSDANASFPSEYVKLSGSFIDSTYLVDT
jgi:hypothetical protein